MEDSGQALEVSDPDFWNGRYLTGDLGWDLGEPSPPFVRLHQAGAIGPCRVVVPGCGRGWEVAWLATHGYQVTGIDFAPEAIRHCREQLNAAGLSADMLCADLFDLPKRLAGGFDLLLEQTCFCAIDPARRPEYAASAAQLLAPGGKLVGLFYACKGEGGPPFSCTADEIRTLFADGFDVDQLAITSLSHSRRVGEEWLGVLTRNGRCQVATNFPHYEGT